MSSYDLNNQASLRNVKLMGFKSLQYNRLIKLLFVETGNNKLTVGL